MSSFLRRCWRVFGFLAVLLVPQLTLHLRAQTVDVPDTDHDGLSDGLEQRLLMQFAPDFRVGVHECAGLPAQFAPEVRVPTPVGEDGTIYGQAFPVRGDLAAVRGVDAANPLVELHFYHLWDRDCGSRGHALDTEHVAVLLRASGTDLATASWRAEYWYAAAHENTVCDASQIARASTLGAETKGAVVWISPGKHASFLDDRLCARGCGADRCEAMKPMVLRSVVNLGESHFPMNGSVFITAAQWPLEAKMSQSNFAPAALARLEALPRDEIGWYNAGRHPAQGVIAKSALTESALAGSEDNTAAAISVAGSRTSHALGRSLHKTVHNTAHALGSSARHVEGALGRESPVQPEE